jgi:hypothetical protein
MSPAPTARARRRLHARDAGGAGKRVHVYTSPHLVRFHERIRLGRPVRRRRRARRRADRAEKVNDGRADHPVRDHHRRRDDLFARHPADVLLLEVGLGGRLDATNVVARRWPRDHAGVDRPREDFLGDTLEEIAFEKAGILKRGRPAIVAPQTDDRADRDRRQAARIGAELFVANRDWVAYPEGGRLIYQDDMGLIDLPARGSRAATSLPTPAPPSRRCAGRALRAAGRGRKRPDLGRLAGALQRSPAVRWSIACPAPRSGSTAGTIRPPGWSSRKPWPTSRSARRSR